MRAFHYKFQFLVYLLTTITAIACPLRAAQHDQRAEPDAESAREVFDLLNGFRQQHGVPTLRWDDRLAQAALDHAYLCAQNKELSHQYPGEPVLMLRLAKKNIRLNSAGENLAMDVTADGAHDDLVHSPPHRANMLSPVFNSVGIAVVQLKENLFVVQDFAHLLPEVSVSEFEQQIVSQFNALRSRSKMPVLPYSVSTGLRQAACDMARHDAIDVKAARQPGARYILAFTISEPQRLPSDLSEMRNNRELANYDIGACFATSPSYPNGVYWVVMAMYGRASAAHRRD